MSELWPQKTRGTLLISHMFLDSWMPARISPSGIHVSLKLKWPPWAHTIYMTAIKNRHDGHSNHLSDVNLGS